MPLGLCLQRLTDRTLSDPAWTEIFSVLSVATIKFEMLSTAPQSQVNLGILLDQGWGLELGDRVCGGGPPVQLCLYSSASPGPG